MELATILGVVCLVVNSHELTVRNANLQLCGGDRRVCVTDKEHCNRLPDILDSRTQVNLTCYFEQSDGGLVSCEWSPVSPGSSLVFTSSRERGTCEGMFWSSGKVNVTVRVHDHEDVVRWSVPHTLDLPKIFRGSQPVVVLSDSSSRSLVLSWTPKQQGVCQVGYAAEHGPRTTQEVKVERDERVVYTLQELLPATLYGATVACMPHSGSWSVWSAEVKGRTLERVPQHLGTPEDVVELAEAHGTL